MPLDEVQAPKCITHTSKITSSLLSVKFAVWYRKQKVTFLPFAVSVTA